MADPSSGMCMGKKDEHGPWFIKVSIRRDRVIVRVCSCHHLEHDLELTGGRRLKASS